jgi:hypothetical protein
MPFDCGHIHTNSTSITTYNQSNRLIISRRNYSRASTAPARLYFRIH